MSMDAAEAAAATAAPQGIGARFKAFKEKHHLAFEVAFFFAGFLFDVVLLHRIDSKPLLMHQALYLGLSALLIFWDHRILVSGKEPAGLVGKIASYRLWVMHFFLGTLLNAFMVFYFRASSGVLAFAFLVALAGLIVANELPRFRAKGPIVRVMLLSFAVTSFMAYLIPVLWGELRAWQYIFSVLVGTGATFGLWKLFTRFTHDPNWTFQRAVLPGFALQGVLLLLYLVNVVPPVPLSLKEIAINSAVTPRRDAEGMHYVLQYQPAPFYQPWRHERATLTLPAGAKAWAFARIFAPAKFQDHVLFAWEYDDPKNGWTPRGKPYQSRLSGGTDEGFHTFAYSTLGKPGTYRVRVLAADGREIGRKTFEYEEGTPEQTLAREVTRGASKETSLPEPGAPSVPPVVEQKPAAKPDVKPAPTPPAVVPAPAPAPAPEPVSPTPAPAPAPEPESGPGETPPEPTP